MMLRLGDIDLYFEIKMVYGPLKEGSEIKKSLKRELFVYNMFQRVFIRWAFVQKPHNRLFLNEPLFIDLCTSLASDTKLLTWNITCWRPLLTISSDLYE